MYFYYDQFDQKQGPYSERAFVEWFRRGDVAPGMMLIDDNEKEIAIESLIQKSMVPRRKIMFEDVSLCDRTLDETNLDVTLDINESYRPGDDETTFHADFTQLDDGVDEVDGSGDGSCDSKGVILQGKVGMYIDRRGLVNSRRRIADDYVPFESLWPSSSWVPHPLEMSDALRGSTHLHNCVQEFRPQLFSDYLSTLNIFNHPCRQCHAEFRSSHEMLCHFVSVPHVYRLYTQQPQRRMSMIDVFSVRKMMREVEALEQGGNSNLKTFSPSLSPQDPVFFDTADISQSFESFRSTATLMQRIPLLAPVMARGNGDVCEYIEAVAMFRVLEQSYSRILEQFRRRSLGISGEMFCHHCNRSVTATTLDTLCSHILSEEHICNSLGKGVNRTEMEYWMSFLATIAGGENASDWRYHESAVVSLQETEFPLCYKLGEQLAPQDFVYSGADVEPVLNFMRSKVRDYSVLDDRKFRTVCRWCHVELCSTMSVLRHVLYDKSHMARLQHVSNEDLRRILHVLSLKTTAPLFQNTAKLGVSSLKGALLDADEKRESMQKLTNVAWRKDKKAIRQTMFARTFPIGLVNWCDVCRVEVGCVEGITVHLSSTEHERNLEQKARIVKADFDYWMSIFNVKNVQRPA